MRPVVSGTFARPELGKLEIVHSDASLSLGTISNYLIGVWRAEITMACAIHWARAATALQAAQPGIKMGAISFLERSCPGPAAAPVLAFFAEAMGRMREQLGGIAVVYPTEGFAAAALRSQLVAVSHDSKSDFPANYALTIEPAAGWLVKTLNDTTAMRAASLCSAVERLRSTTGAFSTGG